MHFTSRFGTVAAIGVLIVVAGCGPAQSTASPSATSSEPQVPSKSVYGRLFQRVGADGSVDKQLALDAFSVAIAPLPGVGTPPGDPPAPYEQADGTFAVRWIERYRDQLTPEQRAAVDAALKPGRGAITVMPDGTQTGTSPSSRLTGPQAAIAGAALSRAIIAEDDERQSYIAILKEAEQRIAQHLGRTLSIPWVLWINDTQQLREDALAYLDKVVLGPLGTVACEISVNPSMRVSPLSYIRAALAHEMFHCFQARLVTFEVTRRKGVPGRYARVLSVDRPPPPHSTDPTGTATLLALPLDPPQGL